MTLAFDLHIGIDYSGRETPTSRSSALQVYAAFDSATPRRIPSTSATAARHKNWSRQEIATWLITQARKNITYIAGIDHGFSFPMDYFQRYEILSWPEFLIDFCEHWPTDAEHTYVDCIRKRVGGPPDRSGTATDLRLTEKWTSSAKSVFQFDVQGSVAKSTHAGIPWLRRIRDDVGDRVHFWPFDGWKIPAGKSVIAESYPSLFRRRFPKHERTADQHDAYSVCRWLTETDARGMLPHYFAPPLTDVERRLADCEGWILGVT